MNRRSFIAALGAACARAMLPLAVGVAAVKREPRWVPAYNEHGEYIGIDRLPDQGPLTGDDFIKHIKALNRWEPPDPMVREQQINIARMAGELMGERRCR